MGMQKIRKEIIKYAVDQEILNINTYSGYKGDLIVKITSRDHDSIEKIKKRAIDIGMDEVVIKENKNMLIYEIYCISPDDVYLLK